MCGARFGRSVDENELVAVQQNPGEGGPRGTLPDGPDRTKPAWAALARVLLASNEFLFVE